MAAFLPLVIFHKQLGDVLLLEPALAKLAAATGSDVTLATRPAFAPLLALMDYVQPLAPALFRRAGSVVSFDPRSRACLQTLTTWAPEKRLILTADKHRHAWHRFIFPTQCAVVDEAAFYRAEYFFNVMPVASSLPFRPPQLKTPPPAWLPGGLPENYVLVHATSAWPSKCWLPEHWAATLDALHAQGIGPFVATGGSAPWEREYVEKIQQGMRAPLLNLCGTTGLEGYLATVARARLVLCIDGSAGHLAAAFKCQAVVLFGPTNPVHWHYPAAHSLLLDARYFTPGKRPAVASIPADVVVAAAGRQWAAFS